MFGIDKNVHLSKDNKKEKFQVRKDIVDRRGPRHQIIVENFNLHNSPLKHIVFQAFDQLNVEKIYCKVGDNLQTTYFYREDLKNYCRVMKHSHFYDESRSLFRMFRETVTSEDQLLVEKLENSFTKVEISFAK